MKKRLFNHTQNYFYGVKGSGKTTHAAYVVSCANKFGIPCYSNVSIHGAYQLGDNIAELDYPEGSVIIIDEAGLEFGSRDFKKLPKEVIEYFKMSRHHKYTIFMYSQVPNDSDKKIREIRDNLFEVKKGVLFKGVSYFTLHRAYSDVDEEGQPCVKYKPITFWQRIFFGKKLVRKKYYPLFDSYAYTPTSVMRAQIPW